MERYKSIIGKLLRSRKFANHHLRQSLVFLDMPTLQQPEAYLAQVDKLLDDKGDLVPATAKFLAGLFKAFDGFAQKNL